MTVTSTDTPRAVAADRIAVIGHGEVGRAYSAALVRHGHEVRAYDPHSSADSAGVRRCSSLAEAIEGSGAVFVLTAASVSQAVAAEISPLLTDQRLYADFTSSPPTDKQKLAGVIGEASSAAIADVAILGPVVALGARTPLMAAGPGGPAIAEIMEPLGAEVDVIDGPVGSAMGHKLLRSVFMKGLAATIVEALEAGRAAGFEPWITEQIVRELAGDGTSTIQRFEKGSRLHGGRRAVEMDAAADYLTSLGVPNDMAAAAAAHLRQLSSTD